MTVKRLSGLVSTLSQTRTCGLAHARRGLHQAVARVPSTQPTSVTGLTSDHLHAIYADLMSPTTQSDGNMHVQAPDATVDGLLTDYAKRGNTRDLESVMSRVLSAPPTEHQRDLHVKAHIVNASLPTQPSSSSTTQQFPTSALEVLHHYEASGHFAPIKSYTRVISALFNVQTYPSSVASLGRAAAQAQAWDLFAHMRYVAHPVPDAHLYALMIRACGSFSRPEPERALDLWMEMQENGVSPTKGAYEAIIRVCGRAGPEWLGEGLRLAREMNDQYSPSGVNGRGLWCALLEGCKRAGDLKKARWILAEAVRGSGNGASSEDSVVDAELMTHVFHTYASYKVPFRRDTTRLVDSIESHEQVSTEEDQAEDMSDHNNSSSGHTLDGNVPVESVESIPSFSRLPPQTSFDVIVETRTLFDMILNDRYLSEKGSYNSPQDSLLRGRFARVELTPALTNAYLSVFYRHASIETSREVFDSLFGHSTDALRPDEHTCINALERCATARLEERQTAARWAEDVWLRWEAMEVSGLGNGKENVGFFARLIERAHAAMRRVLVLSGDIDRALALLRTFVSRYPPSAILQPPSKSTTVELYSRPPILSTRTVLTNSVSTARPLVRLMSAITPKDDRVPPLIAFSDIDVLHARLAEHGRTKELGYLKWVCMAYTNAVKKRRQVVLRA